MHILTWIIPGIGIWVPRIYIYIYIYRYISALIRMHECTYIRVCALCIHIHIKIHILHVYIHIYVHLSIYICMYIYIYIYSMPPRIHRNVGTWSIFNAYAGIGIDIHASLYWNTSRTAYTCISPHVYICFLQVYAFTYIPSRICIYTCTYTQCNFLSRMHARTYTHACPGQWSSGTRINIQTIMQLGISQNLIVKGVHLCA